MGVQTATRAQPQQIRAVQVAKDNYAPIYSLFDAVTDRYCCTTESNVAYADQGGTRYTIARGGYPSQFAYPGDWLLVYGADYNATTNEWTVSAATTIEVWGISAGLPGTAEDFTATFTVA